MNNPDTSIITKSLPAILIGGAPNAGKSVLTYNLTRKLRQLEVPHYVFRAHPDYEGDWFLEADSDIVRQIYVEDYRRWTDTFRQLVCQDLPRRLLPLIVDIGGLPNEKDNCILCTCTHSILLLKDEEEQATQTWRDFTKSNGLTPLAELRSQLSGHSELTAREPVIMGTITGLVRGQHLYGPVFNTLIERICQLFKSYSLDELKKLYQDTAPTENFIDLDEQLKALAPDANEWTPDLLEPLLAELSPHTELSIYGRGPNWLYGALALYTRTQPFHQFDPRLSWIEPPLLRSESDTPEHATRSIVHIKPEVRGKKYIITIHPIHNYLDYTEAKQLAFPEPPPDCGVIVNGKLPFWLFTALARFYAERDVPWIAFNYARRNKAFVIYSRVATHTVGEVLPI